MDIQLKINKSDKRAINKVTQAISTKTNARLLENCSILSPHFVIENTTANLTTNYIYVPLFNRYYFVDNIIVMNNAQIRIECSVDVLESFKTVILNTEVIAKRSTNKYNLYLDDPQFKTLNTVRIQTKKFPYGFSNTNAFILTVLG